MLTPTQDRTSRIIQTGTLIEQNVEARYLRVGRAFTYGPIRRLFEEYAASIGVDLCFQGFAEELAGLPGRYAPPGGGLWLAVERGEAAGCVALRSLGDGTAEMKRLYVRPEHRGRGVGRRLVEHALSAAAALGHRRIVLDTLPSMGAAIEMYRALGFAPVEPYYANPVPGALFLGMPLGER